MSTVFDQVSEWLLQREAWIEQGGRDRRKLCFVWRDVALLYGDESPAACGCLLSLAREAWESVGDGLPVEVSVVPVCRYDLANGRPIPVYAADVRVLCDMWRQEWFTPKADYQPTRGLALAHALLASPEPP